MKVNALIILFLLSSISNGQEDLPAKKELPDKPMAKIVVSDIKETIPYSETEKILLDPKGNEVGRFGILNGCGHDFQYCIKFKDWKTPQPLDVGQSSDGWFLLTQPHQYGPVTVQMDPRKVVSFKIPRMNIPVNFGARFGSTQKSPNANVINGVPSNSFQPASVGH
jgi:hypothetical protein